MSELIIEIGALAKPLKEQLAKYNLPERFINHSEKINHSITMLYLNGYMPESQADRLRKKVFFLCKIHICTNRNIVWI